MAARKVLFLMVLLFAILQWGCENSQSPTANETKTNQPVSDVSGFLKIILPDDAVIDSVFLNIFVQTPAGHTVDIHSIIAEWDENVVSWNSFGGAYDATIINSFINDIYGYKSVEITSIVEDWIDNPNENFGILLRQPVEFSAAARYYSKESITELSPFLKVFYSDASGTSFEETLPIGDTYISEHRPDTNYGTNEYLFTGWVEGNEKQTLLKFEIEQDVDEESPGTGTPGYWMNHPEAWPVDAIEIGGEVSSKEEAIAAMKAPVKKDKTYSMFAALVAAKLNVLIGNDDSCIANTIDEADSWMADNPLGSMVRASSSEWQLIEPIFLHLDEYNNGELCAPPRD